MSKHKKNDGEVAFVNFPAHQLSKKPQAIIYKDLSEDQIVVYDELLEWAVHTPKDHQLLTLGGYAGTGKSTLVSLLASQIPEREIAFVALSGKAANVLKQKLTLAGVDTHEPNFVGTIHSLIYFPQTEGDGKVTGWGRRRDFLDHSLLIVDEASMVDERILSDLQGYKVPILAVGDHGQLPPINSRLNLMGDPDLRLEKIHRQAEGSDILKLSSFVRQYGQLPSDRTNSESVAYISPDDLGSHLIWQYTNLPAEELGQHACLCYSNNTRTMINEDVRLARGLDPKRPVVGDQVICLRNYKQLIFNGMRGIITKISDYSKAEYWAVVEFREDGLEYSGPICKPQFGLNYTIADFASYEQLTGKLITSWKQAGLMLDYGYCLTVHKAQGSGFPSVTLFNERGHAFTADDQRRWLYTAVTRAAERLLVVT